MSIGSNIYALRKEANLTQLELAEKLGVSVQSVSKWECDTCAPDVSLFPVIAQFFGVSIDRIFGYSMECHEEEIQKIVEQADESGDTYREIEIIEAGLKRFPNSERLKIYLAFSLSMVNRISQDEEERARAVTRAEKLCREVIAYTGSDSFRDSAANMLFRIATETNQLDKAEKVLQILSPAAAHFRALGTVRLSALRHNTLEMLQNSEKILWNSYWMLCHILEQVTVFLRTTEKDPASALFYHDIYRNVLAVFDCGGSDFCATDKIFECEESAHCHMLLGDKEGCLAELIRAQALAKAVEEVAKCDDFSISRRNKCFAHLRPEDDSLEEYMPKISFSRMLHQYDNFLSGEPAFEQLKKA